MRIAVIGAGSMGSIYAALLSEAGHAVWAVDPNTQHLEAIRNEGLILYGPSGEAAAYRRILTASDPAAIEGTVDLIVLATKSNHVQAAVSTLGPIIDRTTTLIAMQNGLGAGERVEAALPADAARPRIVLGVAQGFGAAMRAPGSVTYANMNLLRFGEPFGGESAHISNIAKLWGEAGFRAEALADIRQLIWEKFICNVTLSGPCTIFGTTVGELQAVPERWHIALSCGLEAYRIGLAQSIDFTFEDAAQHITSFAHKVADAKPSMLQDHEARRPSEIDVINGRVAVEASKCGLSSPWNTTVSAIVRAREAGF